MCPRLDEPIKVGGKILRNRIVCAPLARIDYTLDENCLMRPEQIAFYKRLAEGGMGMMILGTNIVTPDEESVFYNRMAGLWKDEQIDALEQIATHCHENGVVVLAQLSTEGEIGRFNTEGMHRLEQYFLDAAVRAQRAGCDGVEIHAGHGWFLSLFLDPVFNTRTDEYGGDFDGRLRFFRNIRKAIAASCGPEFIVDIRIAGSTPDAKGAAEVARALEEAGYDMLHVSFGPSPYSTLPPVDFPGDFVCYGGTLIHKAVNIPVMCVSCINTGEFASYLVENDLCDMVAVGRSMCVNPDWARDVLAGTPASELHTCKLCRDAADCYWMGIDPRPCSERASWVGDPE